VSEEIDRGKITSYVNKDDNFDNGVIILKSYEVLVLKEIMLKNKNNFEIIILFFHS
jgi:hypothetical protein